MPTSGLLPTGSPPCRPNFLQNTNFLDKLFPRFKFRSTPKFPCKNFPRPNASKNPFQPRSGRVNPVFADFRPPCGRFPAARRKFFSKHKLPGQTIFPVQVSFNPKTSMQNFPRLNPSKTPFQPRSGRVNPRFCRLPAGSPPCRPNFSSKHKLPGQTIFPVQVFSNPTISR